MTTQQLIQEDATNPKLRGNTDRILDARYHSKLNKRKIQQQIRDMEGVYLPIGE